MPATAPLPLAAGTEFLFFDLQEFAERERLVLRLGRATKHPHNPLLTPGDMNEWDSAQASPWATRTVLYDPADQRFKCWYNGTDAGPQRWWRVGYAESADGVQWVKPRLGLVEFEGRRENNLLPVGLGPVLLDDADPDPRRRFKLIGRNGPAHVLGSSPDGQRWDAWETLDLGALGPVNDAVVLLRDDAARDPARRYAFVWQMRVPAAKPGPAQARAKCLAFSPDARHWTPVAANPILSPNDGFEHENHFLMLLPWKGHYLLLYECGWYHPDGTGRFGRYSADIRLAHSRDGVHFARVLPDDAIIARGAPGEWDGQMLVVCDKAVVRPDGLYLYYCGQGCEWTSWPPENAAPGDRFKTPDNPLGGTGSMRLSQMGLATLRPDGFTALEVADRQSWGTATTVPLAPTAAGAGLRLTANFAGGRASRSWLQAEVLDAASGQPLPGFTRADSAMIAGDGLALPVRWRGGEWGAAPATGPVQLRVWLYGAARLHSLAWRAE